uniref:C2 domain-containing protein n=1 Tax=Amphiprion ocellaris TaxID=80972 RepID=A0AAQ5ZVQ9_AMPOC
ASDMSSVYDFDPITGNIPATKVEITVSLCVLYTQGVETKQWREFGRTEVIDNTLNPDFVRKYILDYFFEEKQNLRFDFRLEKPLGGIPGKKCGTIILSAEELSNCRDSATMQFCANKLDKKDFFGKSDPFMVFYRSNEDGTFTICHKTEVVKNTLNPVWQPFTIPVRALCNGDYDRTIKVEVYDWDRDGSHDFIGDFTTSYRELARGQSQFNVYEVSNSSYPKFKSMSVGFWDLFTSMTDILDPISGTIDISINFTVAIDFTASNGNPSQSTSLHYMNPYQLNAYAMALKAVGEIIQDYDSDKMFPALGFGAKLPPDGRVSHEFPLNGNMENPYCNGIEGILEAYHQSLKTVQLYGPTNFAPVVNHVARYAAAVQDGSQYFVLLIITDGVISDMAQTKEAIVNGAKLPMSIIIVGVGQAEFDAMVELDGDDIRISSRGKLAERDIVQFVPFRDYMDRTGNHVLSMARLAKDVLAEIPDQFISYMKSRGIKPNPAPPPYTPPGHQHHHTQI